MAPGTAHAGFARGVRDMDRSRGRIDAERLSAGRAPVALGGSHGSATASAPASPYRHRSGLGWALWHAGGGSTPASSSLAFKDSMIASFSAHSAVKSSTCRFKMRFSPDSSSFLLAYTKQLPCFFRCSWQNHFLDGIHEIPFSWEGASGSSVGPRGWKPKSRLTACGIGFYLVPLVRQCLLEIGSLEFRPFGRY